MSLVSFEDLKDWTGKERPSAIIKWLKERGVQHMVVDGKPVTTEDQINKAMNDEEIKDNEFD